MESTFILNTKELTPAFIDSLRGCYPDRNIEITIRECDGSDETEYLRRSPANRERLDRAVADIEQGRGLVSFETLDDAIRCAGTQAAQ